MMSVLVLSLVSLLVFDCISCLIGLFGLMLFLLICLKHDIDWYLVSGGFMVDSVSVVLVGLSVWITILMMLAMVIMNKHYSGVTLSFTIVGLMFVLVVSFCVIDFVWFYILFEASLIPTFILIIGWGYQPERMQAGVYMLLYTVVASLPLLMVLLVFKSWGGSVNMVFVKPMAGLASVSDFLFVFSLMAFSVKLPVYMVHLWLPKAHVEAPVAGSMILAGVLLKLGGYGMFRILRMVGYVYESVLVGLIGWALFGGLMVSVMCLRQMDIKSLVALSSVAHMSMVLGGLLTQSVWGVNGAIFIMVGHGFCSSGLFCIANIAYLRMGSRSLSIMKGLQGYAPIFGLLWFLLVSSNMSAPPSLGLLGEMSVIISLVSWSFVLAWVIGGLVFFAAGYSLLMYVGTQHGKGSCISSSFSLMSVCEMSAVMFHWVPLNLLFLVPIFMQFSSC